MNRYYGNVFYGKKLDHLPRIDVLRFINLMTWCERKSLLCRVTQKPTVVPTIMMRGESVNDLHIVAFIGYKGYIDAENFMATLLSFPVLKEPSEVPLFPGNEAPGLPPHIRKTVWGSLGMPWQEPGRFEFASDDIKLLNTRLHAALNVAQLVVSEGMGGAIL